MELLATMNPIPPDTVRRFCISPIKRKRDKKGHSHQADGGGTALDPKRQARVLKLPTPGELSSGWAYDAAAASVDAEVASMPTKRLSLAPVGLWVCGWCSPILS